MAPANPQYTLVGFSPELDFRPLTFLKPLPPNRVCSACGLVRKGTALLPCLHTLCECCYEQCAQGGPRSCPLDGNGYEKDDVTLINFSADELLRREVKCWNEVSGCQYTATVSGISQHFQRECEHHSVRCSKCSAAVLCRDVCAHLRSASCNISTPLASESPLSPDHLHAAASLTSFKGTFERQAAEITAYLRPMTVDITTHGDRLNEISHGINTLKETLRQELASITRQDREDLMKSQLELASSNMELKNCFAACSDTVNTCLRSITSVEKTLNDKLSGTRDDLSKIAAAIEQVKAGVKESSVKTLAPATSPLTPCPAQVAQCEFSVKGVMSLRDTAMKKGWAAYDSEVVYLCGYCMSPGIYIGKLNGSLSLHGWYNLHKGFMDDAVQWPFQHKIRMSVIHPEGGAERALEFYSCKYFGANQKPTESSNPPEYSGASFIFNVVLSGGYVMNDQLRIKWELLPRITSEYGQAQRLTFPSV